MSNDAKLGLVVGVAIVLVIALVFFRNDTVEARAPADVKATAAVKKEAPSEAVEPSQP
jgi:hypothetical protein